MLKHTGELGWLKEVLKRVKAMLRLFRESLCLSGRKVGFGIRIMTLSESAFYTESLPVCLRCDVSPARLTGSHTSRPPDQAILSYVRPLGYSISQQKKFYPGIARSVTILIDNKVKKSQNM